eukprot:TRINITY_DN24061_c0_g3_i1.p1 TRINITY_DN24061_c0_g3~~TRINITY_DN24061_c0_g3_i1.p1  ORF type:complete len:1030 (+),score=208.61 TRINITY_DN24061_c0_g3_i1:117-3206(+)
MAAAGVLGNAQANDLGEGSRGQEHGRLLKRLTLDIVKTYTKCSPADFQYSPNSIPRRVLTKATKTTHNAGYDNGEHDYICRVGDAIVDPEGKEYEIVDRMGHGTFGQVLRTSVGGGKGSVALKIIKNKPTYFHQALVEVRILKLLNEEIDPDGSCYIVRMRDYFVYRRHLCIAFEILSINLYEILKQNRFRGIGLALLRRLAQQLLKALCCLRQAFVIHCDLKPENILLVNPHKVELRLIDFGSACFEQHTEFSYVQSRFYRSPEVIVAVQYTSAIDMWSLGCICAELWLGLPIFPGQSEYDQVSRIVKVLGLPPKYMLDAGLNARKYFKRDVHPVEAGEGVAVGLEQAARRQQEPTVQDGAAKGEEGDEQGKKGDSWMDLVRSRLGVGKEDSGEGASGSPHSAEKQEDSGSPRVRNHEPTRQAADGLPRHAAVSAWRLKTRDEYSRDVNKKEAPSKTYMDFDSLASFVGNAGQKRPPRKPAEDPVVLTHFLQGMLRLDPKERWTPMQAQHHPLMTGAESDENWMPPTDCSPTPMAPPPEARHSHEATHSAAESSAEGGSSAYKEHGASRWQGSSSAASTQASSQGKKTTLREHLIASIPPPEKHPAESYRPLSTDKVSEDFFRKASFPASSEPLRQQSDDLSDRWTSSQEPKPRSKSDTSASEATSEVRSTSGSAASTQPSQATRPPQATTAAGGQASGAACGKPAAAKDSGEVNGAAVFASGQPIPGAAADSRPPEVASSDTIVQPVDPTNAAEQKAGASATRERASVTTAPPPYTRSRSAGGFQPQSGSLAGAQASSAPSPPSWYGGTPPGPTSSAQSQPGSGTSRSASTGNLQPRPAANSRDGSRGSSPWHMSEMSTGYSSQPSGSESPGDCLSEDPSQSDTPGAQWPRSSTQMSGSDNDPTPRSEVSGHACNNPGPGSTGEDGSVKEYNLWDTVKSVMQRVELSRDRLPRRMDTMLSPGGAGSTGNFREAVGYESGPVNPARRDAGAQPGAAIGYPAAAFGLNTTTTGSSPVDAHRKMQSMRRR